MIDDLASSAQPSATYARLRRRGVCRLDDGRWAVADPAAVAEVLTSAAAVVPPPAADDAVRTTMARFSEGEEHRRRRDVAVSALAAVAPAALRQRSRQRTRAALAGAAAGVDVMATVARTVPVATLAEALGAADVDAAVDATGRLCGALAPPRGTRPGDADRALADLTRLLPGAPGAARERHVNVAALLFQAADATAGLIGNVLLARTTGATIEAVLAATLRDDPPVQHTVRRAAHAFTLAGHRIAAGDTIVALLAAATPGDGNLAFGAGRHRCPGSAHALALAAGVLDGLAAVDVRHEGGYEPRANLRIPTRLVVAPR